MISQAMTYAVIASAAVFCAGAAGAAVIWYVLRERPPVTGLIVTLALVLLASTAIAAAPREIALAVGPIGTGTPPPPSSSSIAPVEIAPFVDPLNGCHYLVVRSAGGGVAITPRMSRVGLPVCVEIAP